MIVIMSKKIGIFYGSTTGTTAKIARKIGQLLNVPANDVHDVAKVAPSTVGDYDLIVCGTSTWGSGDMQDDWHDFINGMEMLDLKGKKIAIFGCGDETMSDTFCNAVGELHHRLGHTQAEFIGEFDAGAYDFHESEAKDPATGKMYGLVIDEVNHPELTAARLHGWTQQLTDELA